MSNPKNVGALEGIKVIDFSQILAGPFCTSQLADMGAEVIKVEKPGIGDDTRGYGPPFINGESAAFLTLNRNKKSIVLNLKDGRGLDLARKLISESDVVVQNFRPGTMEKLGLGYEEVKTFDIAPGVGVGRKWVNKKGWTFEYMVGFGRFLFANSANDNPDSNYGVDDYRPEGTFKGGISIGKRF